MDLPQTLPERLYLLAYDTENRRMTARLHLGYLMRAAILAELLLQGHLEDAARGPAARTRSVPDPLLDAVLQQIAGSRRRSWQHWVSKGSGTAARMVRDELAARGWIRIESRRLLGVFPTAKVTVRDTRVVKSLAGKVSRAVRGAEPASRVDPRDAALAALAATTRLRTVLSRAHWRAYRDRTGTLGEVIAPVPKALHKALQSAEIESASIASHAAYGS
ncbi:GOLPH3/VPS74 family protein [Sphaerisporangium fuscum]|uniref:GOLPH3/VPS74 family protein n=1 Tax=Sphaerisporangium fuscum TaxID=2835868 RepID=UPI001BDC79AF|nr:GPP34 family phosphoprotein [Sphaerisporangium fuscum]